VTNNYIMCYTIFIILILFPAYNSVEPYEGCTKPDLSILSLEEQQWFKEVLGKKWTTDGNRVDSSGPLIFKRTEQSSRGPEQGFNVTENGKFIQYGRSPVDVPTETSGCWDIKKEGNYIIINLSLPPGESDMELNKFDMKIERHDEDTLLVQ
jgi:hypothetical protein